MSVADKLKGKRKEKKWTQKILAQKSGVSQQAISFIENARNTPSEGTLRLLAKALDCSISELVDDSSNIKAEQLSPLEDRLLYIFRQLNALGKDTILAAAEGALRIPGMRQEGLTSSMG